MSEIKKMYKNTNVKQDRMCEWTCKDSYLCNTNCQHYKSTKLHYPPFTAEKQIELIKWLMSYPMLDEIGLYFGEISKTYNLVAYSLPEIGDLRSTYTETQNNFEDMLCGLINNLWQDLTEKEREEIRKILKG